MRKCKNLDIARLKIMQTNFFCHNNYNVRIKTNVLSYDFRVYVNRYDFKLRIPKIPNFEMFAEKDICTD